jgi:hypothetical protein
MTPTGPNLEAPGRLIEDWGAGRVRKSWPDRHADCLVCSSRPWAPLTA